MKLEKIIKYSIPVFVLAIISRSIEEISFIYYAVPAMCVFFILAEFWIGKSKKLEVRSQKLEANGRELAPDSRRLIQSFLFHPSSRLLRRTGLPSTINHQPFLLFLIPGLWFLLTSLWSSYPEISATRALYFILLSTGCISAGFLWIRYSGKDVLDFLLPANIFTVLICLFSLITNIPSDSWTGGHGKGFMGFFGHQNLLASVLLFTLPAVWGLKIKEKSKRIKVDFFFFILLSLNLLVLAITYSRSAILALIFGVIVYLILNKNWKVFAYSFGIAAFFTIIIFLTPPLNQFADKIIKKDFPEFYSSRMWMWEPSYEAALEGGLIGLGYGISHPEIRSGEYSDRFENGRLIREKGNSALALVEESGLIGLILFLLPLIVVIVKNKIKLHSKISQLTTHYSLLTAALAALLLHAQFEAWWIGVGSVQLPLFYLYIGLFFDQRTIRTK